MIPYTAADYKKYVHAKGVHRIGRINEIIDALDSAHGFDPEVTNDLGYQLDEAQMWLWLAAFCDDDDHTKSEYERMADPEAQKAADTYSDGRPVTTTFRFGDGDHDYVTHVWHPDPLHPRNRSGAVIEFSEGPYPFRWRQLIVTAPGVIDTLEEDDQ